MSGKRVLAVAWSAAEWGMVHPALDRGELPHLAALVEAGASGPLTTLPPLVLPIAAATVATGFHPPAHGVLAEREPRPDGGGVQPAGARSWRKPALWENLARAGKKTAVVNWPATTPATNWPGMVVDESYAAPEGKSFDAWPLPLDAVTPPSLRDVMRDLRVHPSDIGRAELSALLPDLAGIDIRNDPRPARLATALARTGTVHAAATYIAEQEEWDFLLVHYALLAEVWRALSGVSDDSPHYESTAAGAYRLLDVMLGPLLQLAGPDTDVFVIGPGGWRRSGLAMGGVDEHAASAYDQGLLVGRGANIKRDTLFHRASAVDIAPTLLACFGFSAPSEGKVLDELFRDAPTLTPIASPPAADAPPTPEGDDPLTPAQIKALSDDALARLRNLADAHLALHQWEPAAVLLARLLQIVPDDYPAHLKRGRILLLKRELESARNHAETARRLQPEQPWGDLLLGSVYAAGGDRDKAEPHLARAFELGGTLVGVNLSLGWAAILLQRWSAAQNAFAAALSTDDTVAEAHAGLGVSLHAQGKSGEAEIELRRAIALSYSNPVAHFYLGQILAQRGERKDAATSLRQALAQNPLMKEARDLLAGLE